MKWLKAKIVFQRLFFELNKNEKLIEKNKTPTVGIQTLYILKLEIQRTNYMTLDIKMTEAIPMT